MKIGHMTHPRRDIAGEIRWIGENGFAFVDLFLEPDKGDVAAVDAGAVRSVLAEYGLDVVGHSAWYIPIGSPLAELRSTSARILRENLRLCEKVGAKGLTVHSHWPSGLFTPEEGIALQLDTLAGVADCSRETGVAILYEPVGALQDDIENVGRILDGAPEILLHADIGHMNLHGRNPSDFFIAFGDRLGHVHLHDNDGLRDLHLPPGAGGIDWRSVIPALAMVYDGTITLEIFSQDKRYVLMARDIVAELWKDAGGRVEGPGERLSP